MNPQQMLATDIDAVWCAWRGAGAALHAARFTDPHPQIDTWEEPELPLIAPAASPASFLLLGDGGAARWHAPTGRREPHIPLPAGRTHVLDTHGASRAGATELLATTEHELLAYRDDRWRPVTRFGGAPLLLAWQHRRRSAVVVTDQGTVLCYTPATGECRRQSNGEWAGFHLGCYDEILGGVWLVHRGSPSTALFIRVEPWPPRSGYRARLPVPPRAVCVSHSGEWLLLFSRNEPKTVLYNVSGRRSFLAPSELARQGRPAVFTYDNHLVSTAAEQAEITPIPARAEIRAPGAELDIETFWHAPATMHRATRSRTGVRP